MRINKIVYGERASYWMSVSWSGVYVFVKDVRFLWDESITQIVRSDRSGISFFTKGPRGVRSVDQTSGAMMPNAFSFLRVSSSNSLPREVMKMTRAPFMRRVSRVFKLSGSHCV